MAVRAVLRLLPLFLAAGASARARLTSPDELPLRTAGRWIVDATGRRVKLACVNWSGAEQRDGVVGGLQHQPIARIAQLFASMGFNCVRIPWSVEAVQRPFNVSSHAVLAANPALVGQSTLHLLDAVVTACADARLMVVLDNHMSDADWCCSDTDENGLWYNDRWPEEAWLAAHTAIASRFEHEVYVVAAELRNELRNAVVGGRTRYPDWGGGSRLTDWRLAALRAAHAILAVRPSGLLIVVDALAYSTDFGAVYHDPIALPGRLVYSVHDYSWFFHDFAHTEKQLHRLLGDRWGYLVAQGKPYTAPVWVSEWGDWHDGRNFDGGWWPWFESYLRGADFDWAYWCGDGTQSRGSGRHFGRAEGYGVLNVTWNGPAGVLLQSLQPLQQATQGPGVSTGRVSPPSFLEYYSRNQTEAFGHPRLRGPLRFVVNQGAYAVTITLLGALLVVVAVAIELRRHVSLDGARRVVGTMV
jgi:endoglucanase